MTYFRQIKGKKFDVNSELTERKRNPENHLLPRTYNKKLQGS